jgi:arsenite methyltransferase
MSEHTEPSPDMLPKETKTCCAMLYQSDLARLLLGETFHPGGEKLTLYLAARLQLTLESYVLDVASGPGGSALLLARRFGCRVQGLDYGKDNVWRASARARELGLAHLVAFQQGDAEHLPFPDNTFDALLCECSFCTFPDKERAVSELYRVLKPEGRLGLSDLVRNGEISAGLQGLLPWIACIADAQPIEHYGTILRNAGFVLEVVERHDEALHELVREIQGRLLSVELLMKLRRIVLPPFLDLEQAKTLAKEASAAIRAGQFGYIALLARKPIQ